MSRPSPGLPSDDRANGSASELDRLRRQVARLEQERSSLLATKSHQLAGGASHRPSRSKRSALPFGETGRSMVLLGAVALVGLVTLGLAWNGVAHTSDVGKELPYLVSGGLAAVVMLGTCLGLASIQARRRSEALDRQSFARMLNAAARTLQAAEARRQTDWR